MGFGHTRFKIARLRVSAQSPPPPPTLHDASVLSQVIWLIYLPEKPWLTTISLLIE